MSDSIPARGYLGKLMATGEEVLLIERQHGFVAVALIAGALIYVVVVLAVVSLVWAKYGEGRNWIIYLYLLALLGLPHLLWQLTVWRAHQYIVTNRRVLQIWGVFSKEVIDSALDKVTDVRTQQSLLGRMFNFGDGEVRTASETGKNLFHMIAAPLEFKRAMLDAQQAALRPAVGQA